MTPSTEGASVADNIAEQALSAERLRTAIDMRSRGANWGEVASQCGYSSPAAALRAVGAAMAAATMRAEMTADQMRDEATLRLERLLSDAMSMIAPVESSGYDPDGNPLPDEDDRAVRLRAVDESRRIVESIAKMQGVAVPAKGDVAGEDRTGVRIIGLAVDQII